MTWKGEDRLLAGCSGRRWGRWLTNPPTATSVNEDDGAGNGDHDPAAYLFVATSTDPATIVKIEKSSLRRVKSVVLEPGEAFVMGLTADETGHLYAATYTQPTRLVKVRRGGEEG